LKVKVTSRHHFLYTHAVYHCPTSAWPFGHSLQKVTIQFERHSKGWWDEHVEGTFEVKSSASWKPENPSDPKWRNWGTKERYYCGDLGREYQMTYILNVRYESPINGVIKSEAVSLRVSDQAVCRR
jgi:hypothetical protein